MALAGGLPAQDAGALNPPTPLAARSAAPSPGSTTVQLAAAQRAQDLGLPLLAADLYRQARDVPGAERATLTLALATALLDGGKADEAEKALAEMPEPHGAAWHLRAGLAAVQLRKIDAARAELAAITENELPEADYPWYWFFEGELVDFAPVREMARANDFYTRAEKGARTELERARFQLAAERARLRLKETKEADLTTIQNNYRQFQGTVVGYNFAETNAVALDALGRNKEAVTFLQGMLPSIPRQEREWWDRMRLVLGLIGDKARGGPGRVALNQLVESGHDPLRQRQALEILATASTAEAERKQFRDLLNRLIGAKPDHPIKEALLFYRGHLALLEKDFLQAEEDAKVLLEQFPRSPLRVHALGIQTQSAWEQRRFRLAADFAQKALAELSRGAAAGAAPPAGSAGARVDLGVLVAEARFRAGLAVGDATDFRQAADAYAAVLRERPAELAPAKIGALMFQRVLAEIKAGSGEAGKILDQLAPNPAFDLENRWQAEWSLARASQLQGEAGRKEAYARVNALLRGPPADGALKPELRARMAWLQARLAFENNEPDHAIQLVEALLAAPFEIPAGLKMEIASTAVLLKAQAQFALGREVDALKTLTQLRQDYKKTDAAVSSFLIESEHYATQDKIDIARNRLIPLTDDPEYRNHEVVPYALFRLALLSEQLGREENLIEANKRIEDLIESPASAGQSDLIFAARMKQGDILRKRNDFPAAQRVYEDLVNKYPRRPDVVIAQLELAKTNNAQSSTDASGAHTATAEHLFEQLRDRVDAPPDVRVEAGYNLGKLLERRGKLAEAAKVWWNDVIVDLWRKDAKPIENGAKRIYWLARTLVELGDLQQKLARFDEAAKAYQLVLDARLPYEAVARARLEQLGAVVPKSGQ